MHTCQLFENFMWETTQKTAMLDWLSKQRCAYSNNSDNFHGGDLWKFYMIYRKNLKNSTKNRELALNREIWLVLGKIRRESGTVSQNREIIIYGVDLTGMLNGKKRFFR